MTFCRHIPTPIQPLTLFILNATWMSLLLPYLGSARANLWPPLELEVWEATIPFILIFYGLSGPQE